MSVFGQKWDHLIVQHSEFTFYQVQLLIPVTIPPFGFYKGGNLYYVDDQDFCPNVEFLQEFRDIKILKF